MNSATEPLTTRPSVTRTSDGGEPGLLPRLDVDRLLAQLTLEEKASLCLGSDFWHTAPVERLGVPAIMMSDGPHGLRRQPDEGDHAGVRGSAPATCFPTAAALASSWDPALVERVGRALGQEARDQGVSVVLGPGINIKRSPLCGRNFEYFSEDPFLTGVLGAALVDGVQSQGVGASVKHFAVNNQETDRLRISADVDERTLREIYLAGFEYVVTRARPWTVMCAYNKVNGRYASEHAWLLTEVLRGDWGFDGVVVSDWGAVHDRVAALVAGLDLEMPPDLGVSEAAVVRAVREGRLDESVLDRSVRRVLELVNRAGPVRRDVPGPAGGVDAVDPADQHALARAVARECAVLLKNDGGVLPLDLRSGQQLAVVGEFARTVRFQGAGSSQVNPTQVDVPLDEVRAVVPEGVDVVFAPGYTLDAPTRDEALAGEAVELAAEAAAVVVFLGLPETDESEGFDRTHLRLPTAQTALLGRIAEVNPRVVVVLCNGSAVELASWIHQAAAVLELWLGGQAVGGAVADLLVGATDPGGRLAETLPLRLQDTPAFLNFPGEAGHVRYGEGVFVGYRGYDALDRDVSFPFGHGLSYTTFAYDDLIVAVSGNARRGELLIEVDVRVTNTGDRRGKEVVQLYVGDPQAAVARPVRELKAFAKIDLAPGEICRVGFALDARDLSFWSVAHGRWLLEGGDFEIAVGASSRDLRVRTTIEVDAPLPRLELTGMSTLEEWLADPDGAVALREAVGTDEHGRPRGILADPALQRIIGNFPISTLAAFPGVGITHEIVRRLGSVARRGG